MEVIGGGSVLEYGPAEEGPHAIGSQELWQESVVLIWWDSDNRIGGMHRIGHEPNTRNGPNVTLWNTIFSPEVIFKSDKNIPLRPEDRPANGFNCGDDTCVFEFTDHAIWRIRDEGVNAELHIRDFHTPVDIYPKKGALAEEVAPNHMEVGGRISGTLALQGKHYTINGLAFRDHGWGLRNWSTFVSHRWIAGVTDANTMFLAQTFHSSDDDLVRFGCIIRDNKLTYAKAVDILAYMEPDGLSHRGGRLEMTLTTGEVLRMEYTPLQKGTMSWIHGIACIDTLCKFELGNEQGICDFEMTNNALRGSHRPRLAVNAVVENGFVTL